MSRRKSETSGHAENFSSEIHRVGFAYRKQAGERKEGGREGELHTAAGTGEGGNVICRRSRGQERGFNSLPVSAAGMTKLLSLPLEFTSLPPTLIPSSAVRSSAFSHWSLSYVQNEKR